MPNAGINTMGASEVAGIGIASVAHQAASSIISPDAFQAASLIPVGAGIRMVMASSAAPMIRPMIRLVDQPFDGAWVVVVADILLSKYRIYLCFISAAA